MTELAVMERPETLRKDSKVPKYDPNEIFAAAAALAALGMKVVKLYGVRDDGSCTCSKGRACPSIGKHPAGDGWQHLATDNEEEIATWFEDVNDNIRWNIGVRLGRVSGIVDVEADDEHAIEVMKRFGLDQIDTTAYKGSRGPHYLFQYDSELPDVGVVKVDGLEVRIGGGEMASQSVFPKSWHRTGVQYNWLPGRSPEDVRPARLPDEFKEAVIANSKAKGSGVVAQAKDALIQDRKIKEGGRHAYLLGIASWLAQQCREFSDSDRQRLGELLLGVNQRKCDPPKSEDEVRKIANDQFNHYRNRHEERRTRRPFERYGLIWNDVDREYEPGSWLTTVVHSDPQEVRLSIPGLGGSEKRYVVSLDSKQWVTPKDVAVAVFEATGRIDLLDPNPKRWAAIWNGETVMENDQRRHIRGLRAKLMENAVDEFPPPESNRSSQLASAVLSYLALCEKTVEDEDNLPKHNGFPKWLKNEQGKYELWFKWHETLGRAFERSLQTPPAAKEIRMLRSRVLELSGKQEFDDRKKQVEGKAGRWLIWTDVEIAALEALAFG